MFAENNKVTKNEPQFMKASRTIFLCMDFR